MLTAKTARPYSAALICCDKDGAAMVDVREIDGAIAELENAELTMSRVEKLAALYTVKNNQQKTEPVQYYAAAEPPKQRSRAGDSEFLQVVASVDVDAALSVLDELMSALYISNNRVYNSVMRKLERLQD